jgi:hypothetical protein
MKANTSSRITRAGHRVVVPSEGASHASRTRSANTSTHEAAQHNVCEESRPTTRGAVITGTVYGLKEHGDPADVRDTHGP